jgi:hypothetical protein
VVRVTLRIRIVQTPPVSGIDGIRLDSFQLGQEYEVGNSVGALFLAEGWAEPVPLDAPPLIAPFSEDDPFDSASLYRDRDIPKQAPEPAARPPTPLFERDIAADMYRFRRPRRRRP